LCEDNTLRRAIHEEVSNDWNGTHALRRLV
jgi:hypothetical protein